MLLTLMALAACNPAGGAEPTAAPVDEPTSEPITEPTVEPAEAEAPAEDLTADCPEATDGAHQLIDAANGICFLYPDNYDAIKTETGELTLYVKSPMNTEAPLANVRVEALDGRTIQDIIPDYPSDADLATMSFLTIDLGGEQAMVLDILPGQDTNRHVVALHNGRLVDIMIARIGEDYGEVGQQAEALFQMITESFRFIAVEPDADLVAGPECPELVENSTLYTNEDAGYCLLLPAGYQILQVSSDATEMAFYVDSIQDVTHPRLFIRAEDANGRTLEEVTTAKQEEFADFEVMYSFGYMLDGVPANQFDQLPGQDLNRQVVLVHNDRFYTLTFVPDDPSMGDVYTEMQTLYDTVMDSFSFLDQS
jgi:hypothetical protein